MSHDHESREKRNDFFSQDSMKKTSEGSILHLSENGQDVLVMEMINGKFRVVAGTTEKLFLKLADETTQDFDYVDAYILNHTDFTTSEEFLENLMARFHIEPQPDETEYFKKWQHCIQIKVLNVISRWVKLQYQDFKANPILLTRLKAFINGDITRGGFITEANDIKDLLESQLSQHKQNRHSILRYQSTLYTTPSSSLSSQEKEENDQHQHQHHPVYTHSLKSFVSINSYHSDRSNHRHHHTYHPLPNNMNNNNLSSPPSTPLSPSFSSSYSSTSTSTTTTTPPSPVCPIIIYDSKKIAQYLTLADFYLLKCITSYDYLHGTWKRKKVNQLVNNPDYDYIGMMTKRTNMLGSWVKHEICSQANSRYRKLALKKMIEIAKVMSTSIYMYIYVCNINKRNSK
ncbi:ras guanine nucleotide exchange factor domain-containing protein [Cunninghamella echinulata]|nr:ras guanine nucleotide exchange factor domain-containing protein [Cunninghamella echinulata]